MTALLQQAAPDSLRRVLHEVFAGREYQWTKPAGTFAWLRGRFVRFLDWLFALRETHPVTFYVVLGTLTLAAVAILVHLGYVIWRVARFRPEGAAARATPGPVHDAPWHLEQAQRLSAAGRYAEALGHRFLALVLDLDARRALHFHPAKTPAEYVSEARLDDAGRRGLGELVLTLYRHVFGGAPCGADQWTWFDRQAAEVAYRVAPR